ncbi:type III toxin-antitoxin system CptIN family toxin [Oceanotoga teriensis]|uniref:type III toxin-antitoxin system CptIN family toxin n=1 Tax=Oceanotoga teriensis TaxID=515440 RepID=UPI0027132D69|nr:hypothetical protein [Oceanotoga teriensis]MDO7975829.1 hypothetical protein [Oceanotoga teriensis]
MKKGNFYFLNDQYFIDFPDSFLMKNKETLNAVVHDRPCFLAFEDTNTSLYWVIPFSSKVLKFKGIYSKKIAKYKRCDTIVFGEVLGHEKAFLIQNMCPITKQYINNEYIDLVGNVPVRVDGVLEKELITKAKKVLALQRKGIKLIFPDVIKIEKEILKNISK